MDLNTKQIHKGRTPWMYGQNKSSARDKTGQNTDKGHTPSPRIEITISDPARNRSRFTGLEGSDSTDRATARDQVLSYVKYWFNEYLTNYDAFCTLTRRRLSIRYKFVLIVK